MASALAFDVWTKTIRGTIVLGGNTKEVPDLPSWKLEPADALKPCIDGRWGLFEYSTVPQLFDNNFPYLAWLPTDRFHRLGIPTEINRFRIDEDPLKPNSVFVRHSGWMHRGHLRTEIREKLQQDVVYYIEQVKRIIQEENDASTQKGAANVRPPVIALVRAHNAAFSMRFPHLTYRDLLEYLAGLQRSVAELQAYTMWYDRIQYGDVAASTRSFELGLRGSVATSLADYNYLHRLGVPVWMEVPFSETIASQTLKETEVKLLRVERRSWDDMPVEECLRDTRKGKLVHNKPLEYYPPAVEDPALYELAARGYAPRVDIYRGDYRSAKDVLSMVQNIKLSGKNHNQSVELASQVQASGSMAGDLMEKYASDRAIAPVPDVIVRAPTSRNLGEKSRWFRQYTDMQKALKAVGWAPQLVEAWSMGSQNSDYYPLHHNVRLEPKCKALLLYVAPPPHIFLGIQKTEKMNSFFFIWMCIRRAWLSRIRRNPHDPICWGLTTQKWRDVLSGTYWKDRYPPAETFEMRKFWKYGGPLIFGDDETEVVEADIAPEMGNCATRRLEPTVFTDDSVKSLVLWDLALCHSQLQLDRADEILYAGNLSNPVQLSIRRTRRADVFVNPDWNWHIPKASPPWELAFSHPARRHWLSRLLEVRRQAPTGKAL
ncbi:hypothetical protein C8R43DRAFT_1130571 [Mycena crocata]|nr:hypothetical protein C8R43DRAFT_1130571 [Mycena crocata]